MVSAETSASSTYHASDGAAYEYWLGRWARRLAEPFLDFAAFPHDGDVLDVGCGTGALVFAMAERWPNRRVIGIDIAPRFIEYARTRRTGETPEFWRWPMPARYPTRLDTSSAPRRSVSSCSFRRQNSLCAK